MKRLFVNKDACIGCGLCNATHPEVFEMDDNNQAVAVTDADDAVAEEVVGNCPAGAIEEK